MGTQVADAASLALGAAGGNSDRAAGMKEEKVMGIPSNKAELLLAIDTNFGKLLKALQAVPESRVQELVMEGHSKSTSMSVANLVAYLIGWNDLVIKWIERDAAGLPVDFP
ncbi:TPA: ClbS/DfsB family four-helix bundle protein [Aeromonas salmonicida subsp. pectinolytica]